MLLKEFKSIKKEARQSIIKHLNKYDYTLEDIENDEILILEIILININDIDGEDLEMFTSKKSVIYQDRNILIFDSLLD